MTKAIAYLRFSPRPSAEDSHSNEIQEHECRLYCQKHGYEIALPPFSDPDSHGDDEDRPGLWAAIAALKRDWVLVVLDGSRLARSVYLRERVLREVIAKRARIEFVTRTPNGKTPEDELIRKVLAAFDWYANKCSAARTKAAILRYQEQGWQMSRRPPYGKLIGPAVIVPQPSGKSKVAHRLLDAPEEQTLIQRIEREHLAGKKNREIAALLNAEGVKCRDGEWHHTLVRRIVMRMVERAQQATAQLA